jgi:hypothetical protein
MYCYISRNNHPKASSADTPPNLAPSDTQTTYKMARNIDSIPLYQTSLKVQYYREVHVHLHNYV